MKKGLRAIAEFNEINATARQAVGVTNSDCLVLEARKTRRGKRTPVVEFLEGITEKVWLTSPRGEALQHDLEIHGMAIGYTSPAWVDVLAVNATASLVHAKKSPEESRPNNVRTGKCIDAVINAFGLTDLLYFRNKPNWDTVYTKERWKELVEVYAKETIEGSVTEEIVTELSDNLIDQQLEYSSKMASARLALGVAIK